MMRCPAARVAYNINQPPTKTSTMPKITKLQRRWPGYAPRSAADLVDWLTERIWLPTNEWTDLLAAVARQAETEGSAPAAEESLLEASHRIVGVGLLIHMVLDGIDCAFMP